MTPSARIGESPPRPDGLDKVTGRARYVDDLTMPGLLFGATVRSPHPHARIRSVNAGSQVVTAKDIPGANGVQLIDDTWPVLAVDEVRHVGEAIALVAAPTRLAAREAARAVSVAYEPLAAVLTWEEAEREEPLNVLDLVSGDLDRGFALAAQVVEGTYRTGHQEHIYIECQGMLAWFEGDTLHVVGSMQCPYYVHKALVHAFELPEKNIRVKPAAVGGGFGGKEDYPSLIAIHAALLARKTRAPVKIIYDRHEDIVATTKRHPSLIRHRTGVLQDGTLAAMDIEVLLDGGAYRSLSPVVLSRGVLHAMGPYKCPNVRVRGRVLRTHTAPNAAFRGFGAPQVIFAAERQMDAVARAVGLDPLEIRLRNAVGPGDALATGQVLREDASARLCLETVEAKTNFRSRWLALEKERAARKDGEPFKGIGLSLYFHGAGFTGRGEHRMASPVTVRLLSDGRIEVLTAQTDMGQGCVMVLPQIAAESGGLRLEDVHFPDPDTALVPDSGPTVASRTTMVVGGTIAKAVKKLVAEVLASCGGVRVEDGIVYGPRGPLGPFGAVASECFAKKGSLELTLRHEPPAWQVFDDVTYHGVAYGTYGWGADVVEVQVDPDTLEVKPLKVTVVNEVGKVIHERLCRGQIEGGTLQAIAWGYMEEMKMKDGAYVNNKLATYIIPTVKDSPPMEVYFLERPWEGGPFGAKGVGELPMDGGAPALVAAIENATGIVSPDIPATPEKLFAWREEGRVHGI